MTDEQKVRADFESWVREETELDLHAPYEGRYFYPATAWAWEAWQAAISHACATADAKRLDDLQALIESGQRIEFAKSIFGNGVEIGLRSPCIAKVANTIRDAIDQAFAAKRGG